MSETKWTKGPWRAGRPDMMTVVDGFDSKWIYGANDEYVAVASGRDVETWEDIMANANLMAAAPEMYNALEQLHGFWATAKLHADPEWIHEVDAFINRVVSALKKARGEQ